MRIDRNPTLASPTLARPTTPAVVTNEPKESFSVRFKHGLSETLIDGGNNWKMAAGGAAGLVTGTLCLYSGLVGGALVGSLAGAGLGPAVASMGSHGVASFLGTTLQTTQGAAIVGMAAGATTGLLGGFTLGRKAAEVPGNLAHWAGSKLLGSNPDAGVQDDGAKLGLKNVPMQVVGATLIGAAGAAPGLLGGAVLGGGVSAAGSLMSGLLAHNVTLSSILTTGSTGAIIGGALGLVAGAAGGIALLQGVRRAGGKVVEGEQMSVQYLQLEKKETRLNQLSPVVSKLGDDLRANNGASQAEHDARIGPLEIHEKKVAAESERVGAKEAGHDELSDARSDELYAGVKSGLQSRDDKQITNQTTLDAEDKRVDGKYATKDALVDKAQNRLYDDRAALLETTYQDRKSGLESRDARLHQAEKDIPQTVDHKVQATLAPLRQSLSDHKAHTVQLDGLTANLQAKTATDKAALPGLQAQVASEQQIAAATQDKARQLTQTRDGVQSDVTSLKSQNQAKSAELDRREQGIYDRLNDGLTAREGQLNDYAQRIRNQTESSYNQALAPRESEMRSQIDQAHGLESQARGRRDAVVAAASAAASRRAQAESALNAASSDHQSAQSQVDQLSNAQANLNQQQQELLGVKSELDTKQRDIERREGKSGRVPDAPAGESGESTLRFTETSGSGGAAPAFGAILPEVPRSSVATQTFSVLAQAPVQEVRTLSHSLHDRLEAAYQDRKGRDDAREADLRRAEADIPNQVAQRVEAALVPLRQELQQVRDNADSYDREAASLSAQTSADLASISGIESQANSEREAARQTQAQASRLQPEVARLNSAVQALRAQNEQRMMDLDRREQALLAAGK